MFGTQLFGGIGDGPHIYRADLSKVLKLLGKDDKVFHELLESETNRNVASLMEAFYSGATNQDLFEALYKLTCIVSDESTSFHRFTTMYVAIMESNILFNMKQIDADIKESISLYSDRCYEAYMMRYYSSYGPYRAHLSMELHKYASSKSLTANNTNGILDVLVDAYNTYNVDINVLASRYGVAKDPCLSFVPYKLDLVKRHHRSPTTMTNCAYMEIYTRSVLDYKSKFKTMPTRCLQMDTVIPNLVIDNSMMKPRIIVSCLVNGLVVERYGCHDLQCSWSSQSTKDLMGYIMSCKPEVFYNITKALIDMSCSILYSKHCYGSKDGSSSVMVPDYEDRVRVFRWFMKIIAEPTQYLLYKTNGLLRDCEKYFTGDRYLVSNIFNPGHEYDDHITLNVVYECGDIEDHIQAFERMIGTSLKSVSKKYRVDFINANVFRYMISDLEAYDRVCYHVDKVATVTTVATYVSFLLTGLVVDSTPGLLQRYMNYRCNFVAPYYYADKIDHEARVLYPV